jgi:hypothetical protein
LCAHPNAFGRGSRHNSHGEQIDCQQQILASTRGGNLLVIRKSNIGDETFHLSKFRMLRRGEGANRSRFQSGVLLCDGMQICLQVSEEVAPGLAF